MDKPPSQIRQEIAQTREQLEGTVEALAYKADVTERAKDAVHERVDAVKDAVSGAFGFTRSTVQNATENVQSQLNASSGGAQMVLDQARTAVADAGDNVQKFAQAAQDRLPSADQARDAVDRAKSLTTSSLTVAQNNPLGLALGSLALGFLVGSLLPATRIEREQIGGLGLQISDGAKSAANDLVEQGKATLSQTVAQVMNPSTEQAQSSTGERAGSNPGQVDDSHFEKQSSQSTSEIGDLNLPSASAT